MNVVLRDIAASDADFLFELYRDTRKDEMADWGWTKEQEDSFVRLQYSARLQSYAAQFPDAHDSMILLDDEVIGRILVAELTEEFRLVDIALLPRKQGRGIGTMMIQRLLESARGSGKPVRLHVGVLNPARELYIRLGFQIVQENGGHFLMEFAAGSDGPASRVDAQTMENISENTFRDNLNTEFSIRINDADAVELELIECNDLGSTPKHEQFSILFRGPLQPFLQQMIYELRHEELGDVSIFLVPVRKDSEFVYYEAVFNRFIEQE